MSGARKRSNGLDKLAKGKCRRQFVVAHHRAQQWGNRGLHQCVANAKQRKGSEHSGKTFIEYGQQQGSHGDTQAKQQRALASDFVHEYACGHAEKQKPKEHERGQKIGRSVGELIVGFGIVRGNADQIDKAHDKKTEHEGQQQQQVRAS